jgi:hypothetical protein
VGTPVEISIVAEQRPNALIVPAAAIVREENKTTVFVVGADNKAHRRAVVVGLVSAEEAQIVSGVRDGEKVVVKGQDELPTARPSPSRSGGPSRGGERRARRRRGRRRGRSGGGAAPRGDEGEAHRKTHPGRRRIAAARARPPPSMNPPVSSRHARACSGTALLAAGFISLMSLPSDIYPPLNFPRVVIIGHRAPFPRGRWPSA